MKLKNFKPQYPVTLERWGGSIFIFERGARDCDDIEATESGVLVRMSRNLGEREEVTVFILTGPGSGELMPLEDERDSS